MEKIPLICIFSVAFGGLTKGAGVLPDGPLSAAVGESVTFTTTLTPTNEPLFSVSWKFDDKDITSLTAANKTAPEYEGRITLFIYTGSLELRNVALNDSGEYTISYFSSGGNSGPGNTRLNVYEPVSNVAATANDTDLIEFISSVHLSCSPSGSPPFSFLWLNGSSEVTESDRIQLTDGNSTLTIVNVTRYDQGPFECCVSNPVSNNISNPVNLSISFGPENTKLTISPSKEQYEEGSNITLRCSTVSSPAAQFNWFLNGVKLSETEQELRLINTHWNQSGNYSCQAFNNKTDRYEASQPIVVSVLEKPSGCSSGCIAGIVVACLVVLTAAAVAGYFIYKKRKRTKNSSSGNTNRLGGEGQVNTAYSGNQEPHYADIRLKKSRHSGAARMESEDNATQYAEIRVNNNPPAVSSPPSYDAHMQQRQTTAPQRYQNVTQVHA